MEEQAQEYRATLIEAVAELDDDVMAAFFEGKEPDIADASSASSARPF